MGETSLFRVGDDVELWRVLVHLSVLVVCLLLFERVLHRLEVHAAVSTKYQQLLSKAYRELMILGLIGLGLKVIKEISSVDGSGASITAFQVADLTIFILALALILQTVCIFLILRKHNFLADRAELLPTEDLADMLPSSALSQETQELVQLRLLRHLFLNRFELPQLFPFAKYLRQAQNNQITHMTDVGAPMWALLLGVAWMLEGITMALNYGEPALARRRGLVIVLIGFSWGLLALHVVVFTFFRSCVEQLLKAAGMSAEQSTLESRLRFIAREEARAWTQEDAGNALLVMQKVQEQRELSHREQHRSSNGKYSVKSESASLIEIRWFSRKSWHFTVMMLLMLNGFYLALIVQCVFYQLEIVYADLGLLEVLAIPLPLALNTFLLQPKIFRSFVLVSSIFSMDRTTLSEVVNHFREIVELRSEFALLLCVKMQANRVSIDDLQAELKRRDPSRSGFIDVEKMREVLRVCGLHLSRFRFNSVAKLLFELKEMRIDYGQLLKLVAIAQSEDLSDSASSEQLILIHHHPLLLQSVLSDDDEEVVTTDDNTYSPPRPVLATSALLTASIPSSECVNESIAATSDVSSLFTRPQLERKRSKFQGMSSRTLCDLFHLENTEDQAVTIT
ncbi:hypothetical protein F441_00016 [Phytophthora nicotianae CJ01A1]|uniref:EF-hand domain-containing protein n=3 Tax=Phytophthora nicotianae TaxID=4792 RepID=W3A888_PHYNI|nr:hypothetical protein L915_00020 [Phytophthora nicotianae]ETL50785.1 hypothetical protein L916_00015 [Phytophthora nicotianae]ETM03810.1 hypothetical protein L917_00013 [Phytophthora nicotianae]ETP27476.1 hypothetical protein F441_00016 [Phytophthora nicotianae CJ01A1]ETP55435.1 hypothetical protein F442_00014 [Phytophthora nicotianae P10297]